MNAQADYANRAERTNGMTAERVPTDDAALVLAIAVRRDRTAFVTLFGCFAPRLKAWFMRNGASADRAEDLAQDTMLAVWRRADSYDPGRAAVSAWIFTIGRNQRIDALRRLGRPLPDTDDPSMAQLEPVAPDAALDAARDEARVRAALRDLPREQAEVIRLAFYEERPHSEIERLLGIPLGTVKSRLRLAMGRLRVRLAEPESEGEAS